MPCANHFNSEQKDFCWTAGYLWLHFWGFLNKASEVMTRQCWQSLGDGVASWRHSQTRIQGSLFASDVKMYIAICLRDVLFTPKQYIKRNTSLVINSSDLNYEHVVQLTLALTYPSAPTHSWHTDKHMKFVQMHPTYNPKHICRYINK